MGKFRTFEGAQWIPRALVDSRFTGHTLRHWRSAILGEGGDAVVSRSQPPEPANEPIEEPQIADVGPPLDLTTAIITGTWKVFPQELADYIISMLANDLQSLKACSLVCRFMAASARRVIHRRIYLTSDKNWELLTLPERQRYIRGDKRDIAMKVLSKIAARGLLPYARHLFININYNFTPANLQPFNHHFQCFDRIQELSIYWLDTPGFLENFGTYFANFVPTLRSLHLDTPTGDTRDILDFVCRFPHLDNLTFKMETFHGWGTWGSGSLPTAERAPPFRGRLKLDGIVGWRGQLLLQLISLPGKRRFRTIDFRGCNSEEEQPIIDACSGTLESVSTTWKRFCECCSVL